MTGQGTIPRHGLDSGLRESHIFFFFYVDAGPTLKQAMEAIQGTEARRALDRSELGGGGAGLLACCSARASARNSNRRWNRRDGQFERGFENLLSLISSQGRLPGRKPPPTMFEYYCPTTRVAVS